MSYKTNRIRKNSKAKINAILSKATKIEFRKYYLDHVSDCWTYADKVSKLSSDVLDFIQENYNKDLSITLQVDDQENPIRLDVSGFGGYFLITFDEQTNQDEILKSEDSDEENTLLEKCDDVTKRVLKNIGLDCSNIDRANFDKKLRFTYNEVKQALIDGFVSPLNSCEKVTDIATVQIVMSEGSIINLRKGDVVNVDTYQAIANVQAMSLKYPREFMKTVLDVVTFGGVRTSFTHLMNADSFDLRKAWNHNCRC